MADPGSIRARKPTLAELVAAAQERATRADVDKFLGRESELTPLQILKDIGVSSLDLALGLVPFVQSFRDESIPQAGIDALSTLVPVKKAVPFLLGGFRRARSVGERAGIEGAGELGLRESAREAQEITTPESLAREIVTRRAAREKITGGPVGFQGSRAMQRRQAHQLNIAASRAEEEGIRRGAQQRITDDVLLDNLVEMLESGEIGTIGPIQRGRIAQALPREIHQLTPGDIVEVEPQRLRILEETAAERGIAPAALSEAEDSVVSEVDPAFRAFIEDQMDEVVAGRITNEQFVNTFESPNEVTDALRVLARSNPRVGLMLEERLAELNRVAGRPLAQERPIRSLAETNRELNELDLAVRNGQIDPRLAAERRAELMNEEARILGVDRFESRPVSEQRRATRRPAIRRPARQGPREEIE